MLVLITTTRPPAIRTRSLKGPKAKNVLAPGLTECHTLPVRNGSPRAQDVEWENVCLFVSYSGQVVTSVYRERKVMQCIRHQQCEQNCY